jgi:phosphoserine phosphatase
MLIKYINVFLFKIFNYDFLRNLLVSFLSGFTRIEIEKNVECFMNSFLENRKQHNVIEKINKLNNMDNTLVLASITLDCIAAEVAKRLNIGTFYASELEYENGVCTGKIKHDLQGRKLEVILKNGYIPPYKITISDNLSDVNIMKRSNFSYVVVSKKNNKKWNDTLRKKCISAYEILEV